jgi:hypothetical protein
MNVAGLTQQSAVERLGVTEHLKVVAPVDDAAKRGRKAGVRIRRRTVAKLSQNPIVLTCFGIAFERKQIPRIVENLRKSLNAKETTEADRLRPRQVRYQAALRPDSADYPTLPAASCLC